MKENDRVSTDELLAAARQVFSDEGFGVSTGTIARYARVRESTLNDRFLSKGELFLAAMAPASQDVEAKIRALDPDGDLLAQLEDVSLQLFDFFRELAPVLFVLATDLDFDYEETLRRYPALPHIRLQKLLKEFLQTHHTVRQSDLPSLDTAVLNLFSLLHSMAFFEALGAHGGSCPEEIIREQAGFLVGGLLSHQSRVKP